MKTSEMMGLVLAGLMALGATTAVAAPPMIEVGTSTRATVVGGDGTTLVGSVWISHQGQLRVLWDGVSINGGRVAVGSSSEAAFLAATFPAMTVDLEQLLGRDWMKSVVLKVGAGSIDSDPARGTTDVNIGRISLALTQTLYQDTAWSWTVSETASGNYFRRERHAGGPAFEAIPVQLALDTNIVGKLSDDVAVSLAIGAYGSVVHRLSGGNPNYGAGAYLAPGITVSDRLTAGARFEASLLQLADASGPLYSVSANAFVRYVLSGGAGSNEQAISLKVGGFRNESLVGGEVDVQRGLQGAIEYTVRF